MSGRFMIRADYEGVSGVVSYDQVVPGAAEYAFGWQMFHSDLTAVLEGLNDGGADEIVIYDEHYWGRNVDVALLPANTAVIAGKPPYLPDWAGGLDASFAGMLMVGFHAMAETAGALMPHTYESDIRQLRLNSVVIGEIGMEAAIAGDFGVPLQMVTGDSCGVQEARSLVPGCVAVAVKEARSATGAVCYATAATREWLQSAARQVAASAATSEPYRVGSDATLEITLYDGAFQDAVRRIVGPRMVDSVLTLCGKRAIDVWAEYWHIRNRAQDMTKEHRES